MPIVVVCRDILTLSLVAYICGYCCRLQGHSNVVVGGLHLWLLLSFAGTFSRCRWWLTSADVGHSLYMINVRNRAVVPTDNPTAQARQWQLRMGRPVAYICRCWTFIIHDRREKQSRRSGRQSHGPSQAVTATNRAPYDSPLSGTATTIVFSLNVIIRIRWWLCLFYLNVNINVTNG